MRIRLTAAVIALACPGLAGAQTITFTPTAGVPTFAVREPVLRLKPGAIVETKTFSKPGDYYEGGAWPGKSAPSTSKAQRPAIRSSSRFSGCGPTATRPSRATTRAASAGWPATAGRGC